MVFKDDKKKHIESNKTKQITGIYLERAVTNAVEWEERNQVAFDNTKEEAGEGGNQC